MSSKMAKTATGSTADIIAANLRQLIVSKLPGSLPIHPKLLIKYSPNPIQNALNMVPMNAKTITPPKFSRKCRL